MSTFFVDTSALAKRDIPENGSSWVLSWIVPATQNIIVVSDLVRVKMRSLIARRLRERTILPSNRVAIRASFLLHLEREYLVTPVDEDILNRAGDRDRSNRPTIL